MAEPTETATTLSSREVTALTTLERLAAERARSESETEKTFRERREGEEKEFQGQKQRVTTVARNDTQETKGQYQAVRDAAVQSADTETKAIEAEYAEAKRKVAGRAQAARNAAKKIQEETRWQALAVFEAGKDAALKQFQKNEAQLKSDSERLEDLKADASAPLARTSRFARGVEGTTAADSSIRFSPWCATGTLMSVSLPTGTLRVP